MSTTPNCGITNIDPTLSPIPQINDALRVIDALLQCAVLAFQNDPPVSPADGDQYIVGTGTGAWVGQDDNLAQWVDEGAFWNFYEAGTQVRLVLNLDDGGMYAHGAGWTLVGGLPDAPSDGTIYGRQNGAWVDTGGVGTVSSVNGDTGAVIVSAPICIACSDETTALTTGTAKVTFRMPYAFTLTEIPRASLTGAQASGSIFTVDINESGVSILSTKLTIDNTEKTSTTAATPAVVSDTSLANDAEITIDIDQIGTSGATGLKVWLIGYAS